MAGNQDIKVGDIGTVYFLPTYDNDLTEANFDPSSATTKQIVFKMPGSSSLCTRTATATTKTISGVSVYGLQYTVVAADVATWSSASVGGFHQSPGAVKMEGYVEFSSSQKWSSGVVTVDQQGRPLRVVARLA
jgi:hypothetical protein